VTVTSGLLVFNSISWKSLLLTQQIAYQFTNTV